jgi:hypothetical protein
VLPAVPSTTVPPGLSLVGWCTVRTSASTRRKRQMDNVSKVSFSEFLFFHYRSSAQVCGYTVTPCPRSRKDRVGGERKRLHAPTISLRCLDNAKCGSIFYAPTRVLEFRFAINFRARLLRKAFQVDLRPQGSDTMLPTEEERKEQSHERGVSHSTCEAVHGI